jgi:hypothetical protein
MKKHFSASFISNHTIFITGSSAFVRGINRAYMATGLGFANHPNLYNVESETEILEDWFNLDYSFGMFSAD